MTNERLREIRRLVGLPQYEWLAMPMARELLAEVDQLREQVATLGKQLDKADEVILRLEMGEL